MNDNGDTRSCDVPEPHARRITIKGDRYLIFFEFDGSAEEATGDMETNEDDV